MISQVLYRLLNRISRLNVDLQHLVVLTFPRTQSSYEVYLYLRDNDRIRVFSQKLTTHPVYFKSIVEHLDVPTFTVNYYGGIIRCQAWHNKDYEYHREGDLPAVIEYYEDGNIRCQEWYKNGNLHRENNKYAYIKYHFNGMIECQKWSINGNFHQDPENDEAAVIHCYDNGQPYYKGWFINGNRHRSNNLPAKVWYFKNGMIDSQSYYEHDILINP